MCSPPPWTVSCGRAGCVLGCLGSRVKKYTIKAWLFPHELTVIHHHLPSQHNNKQHPPSPPAPTTSTSVVSSTYLSSLTPSLSSLRSSRPTTNPSKCLTNPLKTPLSSRRPPLPKLPRRRPGSSSTAAPPHTTLPPRPPPRAAPRSLTTIPCFMGSPSRLARGVGARGCAPAPRGRVRIF